MRRIKRVFGVPFLSIALLGAGTSPAAAERPAADHCVSPAGDDLNAIFSTPDSLVAPFCTTIAAGDPWRAIIRIAASGSDHVFPAGYTAPTAPLDEDFLAKLVSVRLVVDAGTRTERSYLVTPDELILRHGGLPDSMRFVAWASERRHPLPPGEHTVDQHVTLSAAFWDGLGLDPAVNQIPAGESFATRFVFDVVTPRG